MMLHRHFEALRAKKAEPPVKDTGGKVEQSEQKEKKLKAKT